MNHPKRYRIRTHPFSKVVELVEDENGEVMKASEVIEHVTNLTMELVSHSELTALGAFDDD